MDLTDYIAAAQNYACNHGHPYCCYYDHDDELCVSCLQNTIKAFRAELKRLKESMNDVDSNN